MSKMNFGDVWRVLLIYVLMLVVGVLFYILKFYSLL